VESGLADCDWGIMAHARRNRKYLDINGLEAVREIERQRERQAIEKLRSAMRQKEAEIARVEQRALRVWSRVIVSRDAKRRNSKRELEALENATEVEHAIERERIVLAKLHSAVTKKLCFLLAHKQNGKRGSLAALPDGILDMVHEHVIDAAQSQIGKASRTCDAWRAWNGFAFEATCRAFRDAAKRRSYIVNEAD